MNLDDFLAGLPQRQRPPLDHMFAIAEINSFTPMTSHWKWLAEFLEHVRTSVIVPFIRATVGDAAEFPHVPGDKGPFIELPWGEPNGVAVQLLGYRSGRTMPMRTNDGAADWARIRRELADGRLQRVMLEVRQLDGHGRPLGRIATLEFDDLGSEFPGVATRLKWVTLAVVGREEVSQSQWIALADEAMLHLSAATGYLTVDSASDATAYEDEVGLVPVREGLRTCDEYVRGYAWGTYLTARHIDRLGGIGRIRRQAPVVDVRDVSRDGYDVLFLQAADKLLDVTDDQLRALKAYLAPVLHPPTASEYRYVGSWRRIV